MKKFFTPWILFVTLISTLSSQGQCIIDTTNTHIGFTPAVPAVISPGVAYSQTVQVYVPPSYNIGGGVVYTVDSLHISSIAGVPAGLTYTLNPASGTVLGGKNGAMCFNGITNDTVGPYPLTFTGDVFTNAGPIPFSYLVTLSPGFGYKFRIETAPLAGFNVDSPICASGDTVRFVDLTTGYPTRWAWTFAGGTPATSTTQFPRVVYDSAGTYSVTLIGRNSISADTITKVITVNPSVNGSVTTIPATGATITDGGAAVNAAGGTPPFSYLWSNSSTSATLSNVVQGQYTISVTDSKGCQYVNDTVSISFINGILQLTDAQHVNIYPNPAHDVLTLDWSQKTNALVSLIDMNGNVAYSFNTVGDTKNVFDLRSLPTGAYILRITNKTTSEQKSFLFSKF